MMTGLTHSTSADHQNITRSGHMGQSSTHGPDYSMSAQGSEALTGTGIVFPSTRFIINVKSRGGEPMATITRCPCCIEGDEFKAMIGRSEGEWFLCVRCSHVTVPHDPDYQCKCARCNELGPSTQVANA